MEMKGSSNSGICISWNGEHKKVKGSSSSGIFMSWNGVSEKKDAGVKEDLDISKHCLTVAAGLSNRPVARSHIAVGAMGLPLHVVCGGAGQLWIPRT
jgi:hypothetical protein